MERYPAGPEVHFELAVVSARGLEDDQGHADIVGPLDRSRDVARVIGELFVDIPRGEIGVERVLRDSHPMILRIGFSSLHAITLFRRSLLVPRAVAPSYLFRFGQKGGATEIRSGFEEPRGLCGLSPAATGLGVRRSQRRFPRSTETDGIVRQAWSFRAYSQGVTRGGQPRMRDD